LLTLAPLFLFAIKQRFPTRHARRRERNSAHWTNLGLVALTFVMGWLVGFQTYFALQLGVLMVASSAGVWLFYVQHQFEGVYWERGDAWDYEMAALKGSSFYKLPKLLQWFSGNIGFHHIHHLNPRIPNYKLEQCHKSKPCFEKVKPMTLLSSLRSLSLRLWDEPQRKLVGFRAAKNKL
jgi:omega-6 fatty acid desaturase (delta-12 desaturase)